jgi:rhodanese-related sulfurtransferase
MNRDGAAYRSIPPREAEALVREGAVHVLDVRSPEEYRELGHIPGSMLLPLGLIACGPATLPRDQKPILVACEHGIRSVHAARFLARAGVGPLLNLSGGMSQWSGPREHSSGEACGRWGPSSWLIENADLIASGMEALDLACGSGRHALLLATAGLRVHAVDADAAKIAALDETAKRLGLDVRADVLDLEVEGRGLGEERYDLIAGIHYLHRPLFPAIARALRRGGLLIYETFTEAQAKLGKPTHPAFLLKSGELEALVKPLEVIRRRPEGCYEGRQVAGVAARKPRSA